MALRLDQAQLEALAGRGLLPDYPLPAGSTMALAAAGRAHKFNARPDHRGALKFQSKAEALYYDLLELQQRARALAFFLMQVPFHLPGSVYKVDFAEFWVDGRIVWTDVKGYATEAFKVKRRAVEALYPLKIQVARRAGRTSSLWEYS